MGVCGIVLFLFWQTHPSSSRAHQSLSPVLIRRNFLEFYFPNENKKRRKRQDNTRVHDLPHSFSFCLPFYYNFASMFVFCFFTLFVLFAEIEVFPPTTDVKNVEQRGTFFGFFPYLFAHFFSIISHILILSFVQTFFMFLVVVVVVVAVIFSAPSFCVFPKWTNREKKSCIKGLI